MFNVEYIKEANTFSVKITSQKPFNENSPETIFLQGLAGLLPPLTVAVGNCNNHQYAQITNLTSQNYPFLTYHLADLGINLKANFHKAFEVRESNRDTNEKTLVWPYSPTSYTQPK